MPYEIPGTVRFLWRSTAGIALQELNRVAGKPGMRALHLPNSIEGNDYLFEPAYVANR